MNIHGENSSGSARKSYAQRPGARGPLIVLLGFELDEKIGRVPKEGAVWAARGRAHGISHSFVETLLNGNIASRVQCVWRVIDVTLFNETLNGLAYLESVKSCFAVLLMYL